MRSGGLDGPRKCWHCRNGRTVLTVVFSCYRLYCQAIIFVWRLGCKRIQVLFVVKWEGDNLEMLGGKSESCFYDKLKIACFLKSAPDILRTTSQMSYIRYMLFGTCFYDVWSTINSACTIWTWKYLIYLFLLKRVSKKMHTYHSADLYQIC